MFLQRWEIKQQQPILPSERWSQNNGKNWPIIENQIYEQIKHINKKYNTINVKNRKNEKKQEQQ